MRNRTRAIAAATIIATLAAGSTAAAASATDGKTGTAHHVKIASRGQADNDLASRLGISPARLDSALRAAKSSLAKTGRPTEEQFYAALAHNLGIPPARARQAFSEGPAGSKRANSKQAEQQGQETLAAAVAQVLHLSPARVYAALRPLFAAGRAEEPSLAAAARSLGVTPHQLDRAVAHAKQSLTGGK
ncbi:MAG TPA: hypothetical protein VHC49_03400 [Mycobacteriales bacterium]|nr:hypothetical protein [Mycobacteriales bacterium]